MKTIYIGALPFKTNEQTLLKLLEPFKPAGTLKIFADWENPTFEPYALVQVEHADAAIQNLDGHKIGTTHLRVHENQGVKNV